MILTDMFLCRAVDGDYEWIKGGAPEWIDTFNGGFWQAAPRAQDRAVPHGLIESGFPLLMMEPGEGYPLVAGTLTITPKGTGAKQSFHCIYLDRDKPLHKKEEKR